MTLAGAAANNQISSAMVLDLRDALERVAADESIRVFVLGAAPGRDTCFPNGMTADAVADVLAGIADNQPPQLIANLRVPSVAALFGDVAGPAFELALACDVRVAADDATFSFPQVDQGSLPIWGGTQRLSRVVGIGRALEIVLLGRSLAAMEALAMGLVTRTAPRTNLDAEVQQLVDGWLAGAPIALAYAKEAVRQGGDLPLDHALRLEWDLAVLLETTRDRTEGIRAFLEKREPHFTGE